jgi:hypothetical protein
MTKKIEKIKKDYSYNLKNKDFKKVLNYFRDDKKSYQEIVDSYDDLKIENKDNYMYCILNRWYFNTLNELFNQFLEKEQDYLENISRENYLKNLMKLMLDANITSQQETPQDKIELCLYIMQILNFSNLLPEIQVIDFINRICKHNNFEMKDFLNSANRIEDMCFLYQNEVITEKDKVVREGRQVYLH